MVRFTRARPRNVSSASVIDSDDASLRNPDDAALPTGTRRVMRFSSKVTTMTCKAYPAADIVSMPCTVPTPWVG